MHFGALRRTAPRLLALALCLPWVAHAALAALVQQFVDTGANGKTELVCVYRYEAREFERRYPVGNFCPAYEEV